MKKILFLFAIFSIIMSCDDDNRKGIYEGDAQLTFNNGTETQVNVITGTGDKNQIINFGAVRPTSGPATVNLVFDAANSTAVLGTDFEIVKGTEQLPAGALNGTFEVKIKEGNLTTVPKVAVFKLDSPIRIADFNNTYTLSMAIACPPSAVVGSYNNDPGFWNSPSGSTNGGVFQMADDATNKKILFKNFFGTANDLEIKYNDDQDVFEVVEKDTGSNYTYAGVSYDIYVRQRAGSPNEVDLCNKKFKFYTQYFLNTTTLAFSGDTSETFVGL